MASMMNVRKELSWSVETKKPTSERVVSLFGIIKERGQILIYDVN